MTISPSISVEPAEHGSSVHYDALLSFSGLGRLFDPVLQRIFDPTGKRATAGMRAALNP